MITNNLADDTPTRATRSRGWMVPVVAMLPLLIAACGISDQSAADPPGQPLDAQTSRPSATPEPATSAPGTAATPTSAAPTTVDLGVPLDDDDRVFTVGGDMTVVAAAPAPWEPFANWGMLRDGGTLEWVGLSFWIPLRVATDSCQWHGNLEAVGDSVADLAAALVAVPGRQATEPLPVTVGGYDGLYLEWSLPADIDLTTCDGEETAAWTGVGQKTRRHDTPGQIDRIWILDVEGQRVLIDVISLPVEQKLIRKRVDEVIGSLRFVVDA